MHLYGPLPIASAPTGPSGALSRKRSRESGYRIVFRNGSALLPPGARLQPLLYTGQPGSGPTVRVQPKIPPPAGTLTHHAHLGIDSSRGHADSRRWIDNWNPAAIEQSPKT